MAKYGNSKVIIDGICFDSKDEAKYYELLKKKKASEEIINFELQPKYELQPKFRVNGKGIRAITYSADFLVYHLDGTIEAIDVKGMSTQQGEIRRKMFYYKYPDIKLTWVAKNLKWATMDGEWILYDDLQKIRRDNKKAMNLQGR